MLISLFLPNLGFSLPAEAYSQNELNKARFIVEFEPSFESAIHKRFLEEVNEIDLHHHFDHEHFRGMSFSVVDHGDETLEELRKKPGVRQAWRAKLFEKRDVVISPNAKPMFNPHSQTGVQELHDRNITGEGIVIGMIDSGIDWNHPALKGKLLPGYDFCDNSTQDSDVNDESGHGTFCASVAVGSSSDFMGVAPGAKLRMYKVRSQCVLSSSPQFFDDALLAALLKAYDDKVDLISISQGLDTPFAEEPYSLAVERIAEKIPVLLSASNSGEQGLYSGMNGAAADNAIAVGSYQSNQLVTWNATLVNNNGNNVTFTYVSENGWVLNTNSTYDADYAADLCSLQKGTDNSEKFVIGKLSASCKYLDALEKVAAAQYKGVFVLESRNELSYPQDDTNIDFIIATSDDFLQIFDGKSKPSISLGFNMDQQMGVRPKMDNLGLVMSGFSSWGPTFRQSFYPHIAGPGGKVVGAKANGTFDVEDGTSFSCPYVAGVVALYLSGHKNASSQQVRNSLISTAKMAANNQLVDTPTGFNVTINRDSLAPVLQQGNGYVDLVSFYDSKISILSAPYLHLNDTAHRVANHVITFQNNGRDTVKYNISHKSYRVVYSRNSTGMIALAPPREEALANIVLYSMNLTTLKPGETASFNVSISAPDGLNQTLGPILSGVFTISDSTGGHVNVPYIGMEFDATAWSVWSPQKPLKIGNTDDEGAVLYVSQSSNDLTVINKPYVSNPMAYGTTELWFDLVDASYNLSSYVHPPAAGKDGYIGPLKITSKSLFAGSSPISFIAPVSDLTSFSFEEFSNGTTIPDGTYKLMHRALNNFGNASNSTDWSLGLTPAFSLKLSNETSQNTSSKTRTSKGGSSTVRLSYALILIQVVFSFL